MHLFRDKFIGFALPGEITLKCTDRIVLNMGIQMNKI